MLPRCRPLVGPPPKILPVGNMYSILHGDGLLYVGDGSPCNTPEILSARRMKGGGDIRTVLGGAGAGGHYARTCSHTLTRLSTLEVQNGQESQ